MGGNAVLINNRIHILWCLLGSDTLVAMRTLHECQSLTVGLTLPQVVHCNPAGLSVGSECEFEGLWGVCVV